MDSLGESTLRTLLAFTALRLEFNWSRTPVNAPRLENLLHIKRNQLESAVEELVH